MIGVHDEMENASPAGMDRFQNWQANRFVKDTNVILFDSKTTSL